MAAAAPAAVPGRMGSAGNAISVPPYARGTGLQLRMLEGQIPAAGNVFWVRWLVWCAGLKRRC